MNKEARHIIRKFKRAGGRVERGVNGRYELHGPRGFYILHTSMSAGREPLHMTKRLIRLYTGVEL